MIDRCRRVVGERETTVNPAGKVVTQPPESLPASSGSRKMRFVRNQEHVYPRFPARGLEARAPGKSALPIRASCVIRYFIHRIGSWYWTPSRDACKSSRKQVNSSPRWRPSPALSRFLQRWPDPFGGSRHLDIADTEALQGMADRVDEPKLPPMSPNTARQLASSTPRVAARRARVCASARRHARSLRARYGGPPRDRVRR